MRDGMREFDGHEIDISSTDKVFFPDAGISKGDLLDYADRIGEIALPHLAGRLVALKRYPDGITGQGWFQKNTPGHFPDWLRRVPIAKKDGSLDHLVIEGPADLVYLANQGTIELHGWVSLADAPDHPDQAIIDLDPPEDADVSLVRRAARLVHGLLDEVGLPALLKTSGSKGYHVHVPLDASETYGEVRPVIDGLARVLAERHPDLLTTEFRKANREGRVFLDTGRNAYGQTAVTPYTVRARPGAPIATPIEWDELARAEPRSYTVTNIFRRLGQRDDPWQGAFENPGTLASARTALDDLREK